MALCDRNANCLFIKETNGYTCQCKAGYSGDGSHGNCRDNCLDFCRNEGICLKVMNVVLINIIDMPITYFTYTGQEGQSLLSMCWVLHWQTM